MRDDENHRTHLAVLTALSRVSDDLPAFIALLADADDDAAAGRRLQDTYDFSPIQGEAVLDAQCKLLNRARRAALGEELQLLRQVLEAPWDPPLDTVATVHSPRRISVVIDGD